MIEYDYFGITIKHWPQDDLEAECFRYSLCGWIYEAATLDEAKEDIRQNWRQDRTYWKNF